MANGFSTFKEKHHYASGIILVVVGVTGIVGSFTGNLASMIAALWVPDILFTSSGSQADAVTNAVGDVIGQGNANALAGANSVANTILKINPVTGPITWVEGLLP
jgi:hypothetical protein